MRIVTPQNDASRTTRSRKPRATRQRAAVSEVLDELNEFRSAQDLYTTLRERGEAVGLTTIYRTLQSMAEAGEVDSLRTADGESLYRRCSDRHHHHLVCRHCGYTVEVEGPAVERWTRSTSERHGFVDVDHTVEVVGTCAACAQRSRRRSPRAS